MKTPLCLGLGASLWLATLCPLLTAASLQEEHLRNHNLPPGPAASVLPGSALIHIQINHPFRVLERLESMAVSALPMRMLPPEMQDLLATEHHPLMIGVGMQTFGEPIDAAMTRRRVGFNPEAPLALTLYPGDPRRTFVLSLPIGDQGALRATLNTLLNPQHAEMLSLSGHPVVRIETQVLPGVRELYLVCSAEVAYLSGDRSLALALHSTPRGQRLDRDPFLGRVLHDNASRDAMAVFNPAIIRPLVLQIQQIQPLALMLLQQQRERWLANIPDEVRRALEAQLWNQFGVRDLNQLANYLEAILKATLDQTLEFTSNELIGFEGVAFAADLEPGFPQLNMRLHSRRFRPETAAGPVPLDEARETLRLFGEGSGSIQITGHQPPREATPALSAWTARVRAELAQRELPSRFFDGFARFLANQRPLEPIETRVDWTLTSYHAVHPQPRIEDAASLTDYFSKLEMPIHRKVKVLPDADLALLESWFKSQAEARNANRALGVDFARSFSQYEPWFDVENRVRTSPTTDLGIQRYVTEDAIMTRGGLFGYDQHEFVSRRLWAAREVNGSVVYHQGRGEPAWLQNLTGLPEMEVPSAIQKLLARVPVGANHVKIERALQHLPSAVQWLASLENRIHADLNHYLEQCRREWNTDHPEKVRRSRLEAIPMPELTYALSFDPESETFYCLLPGNIPFPRGRLLPVLQDLLSDYAAGADDVGGSVFYTRVQPEMLELGMIQSTEGFARLTSSTGNRLFEQYLSQPHELQALQQSLVNPYDGSPELGNHILFTNPRWNFLPQPQPKTDAAPSQPIPERPAEAGEHLVDLTGYYHGSLTETWHVGGLSNNTLASLSPGIHTFSGIEFDRARGRATRRPRCTGGLDRAVPQADRADPRRTLRTSHPFSQAQGTGYRGPGAGTVPLGVAGVTRRGPVDGRDVRLGPWIRGR
jgi:hypothetical protein